MPQLVCTSTPVVPFPSAVTASRKHISACLDIRAKGLVVVEGHVLQEDVSTGDDFQATAGQSCRISRGLVAEVAICDDNILTSFQVSAEEGIT